MENSILTNIKLPNEIVIKKQRYNSKTPQQYFDQFTDWLTPYGIFILGFVIDNEWKGNSTKICFSYNNLIYKTFTIAKLTRYYNGISKNGFNPPKGSITPEILNDRCKKICMERKLKYIGYDNFNAAKTKLILSCISCNFVWKTTIYDSFVNNKRGCPSCTTYGYSQNKVGYFYIMKIHYNNKLIAYKIGITNNLELRMTQLKRACMYDIDLFYVIKDCGSIIFDIESKLKKKIKCNYLTENILTDGYTETIHPCLLNKILIEI